MGTAPGQSTPGTQSVPGQTPQTEPPATPGAEGDGAKHPEHLQGLLCLLYTSPSPRDS